MMLCKYGVFLIINSFTEMLIMLYNNNNQSIIYHLHIRLAYRKSLKDTIVENKKH